MAFANKHFSAKDFWKEEHALMKGRAAEEYKAKKTELEFEAWAKTLKKTGINTDLVGEGLPVNQRESLIARTLPTNKRQNETLVWYPRNRPGGGYNDPTCAVDPLHYYNIQDLLARFFIYCHAHWGVIENWRDNVIGCTSLVQPELHMPMFDYDGKNIKKTIRKDVKLLQEEYGLGNAWVYETRRGFHIYFFCDAISWGNYRTLLAETQGCVGFKRATVNRGYAVLRVSAKYTDFDIKPLYILPSGGSKLRRMPQKAHVIQALLKLGEQCGTHFASMYPQWAHFQQDYREWKPASDKPGAKRIKKAKKAHQVEGRFTVAGQNLIIDNNQVTITSATTMRWSGTTNTTSTDSF